MKVKPANQPNAKLARKAKQSTQKGKTEQLSASDESEADEEEEDDEDEEEEDEAEEDHEGRKSKNKRPPNVQRGSVSSAPATPAAKPPFPPQSPIDTLDAHSDVDKQLATLRMQLKTKKLAEVARLEQELSAPLPGSVLSDTCVDEREISRNAPRGGSSGEASQSRTQHNGIQFRLGALEFESMLTRQTMEAALLNRRRSGASSCAGLDDFAD